MAVHVRCFREEKCTLLDRIQEVGRAHDETLPQVARAGLLSNPLVTAPSSGANSVEQLQASLGAVGWRLDEAELEAIDELTSWQQEA